MVDINLKYKKYFEFTLLVFAVKKLLLVVILVFPFTHSVLHADTGIGLLIDRMSKVDANVSSVLHDYVFYIELNCPRKVSEKELIAFSASTLSERLITIQSATVPDEGFYMDTLDELTCLSFSQGEEALPECKPPVSVMPYLHSPTLIANSPSRSEILSINKLDSVLGRFSMYYKTGDITGISSLFHPVIVSNDTTGKNILTSEYAILFTKGGFRSLEFENMAWELRVTDATASGIYTLRLGSDEHNIHHTATGTVNMNLIRTNNGILIKRFIFTVNTGSLNASLNSKF